MNRRTTPTTFACMLLLGAAADADEGKDGSGKGNSGMRRAPNDTSAVAAHIFITTATPTFPTTTCRRGVRAGCGTPTARPGSSRHRSSGQSTGPTEPGAWVFSPGPGRQEIDVRLYDERRPGLVIDGGIFDARTGSLIRVRGQLEHTCLRFPSVTRATEGVRGEGPWRSVLRTGRGQSPSAPV